MPEVNKESVLNLAQGRCLAGILLLLTFFSIEAYAAGDPASGEKIFLQCSGCHTLGENAQHRFGPMLNGVMQRPVASATGFSYSNAFSSAAEEGVSWNAESLGKFLSAPMQVIPGTKMAFPGLSSEQERVDVIAYMQQFDADGSRPQDAVNEIAVASVADKAEIEPRPLARDIPIPDHGVLHLGRTAFPEEIQAWDIDVRPDGLGLQSGSGSVAKGGELYDVQCSVCHGAFGEGEGRWPILAGGFDTLTDERPEKTIGSYWPYLSTVYDYVRRAMPFGNARSLSDDDVYSLTAYLMYLNDLVDEDFVLTQENFTTIRLPNEDNFFADNRHEEPHYASPGDPCMSNCIPGVAVVSQRARVLDVTPDNDDESASGSVD